MPLPESLSYRPRVLVVSQDQFGYLTDSYQYALHLRKDFDVTYLGWDFALPRITLDDVAVRHVPRRGNKLSRYRAFLAGVLREIRDGQFDVALIVHFWGAGIYPLLVRDVPMIMDVRTGYVRKSNVLRWLFNRGILLDSLMFKHVAVISESLGRYLHIRRSKLTVFPLGAEDLHIAPKRFDAMRLLYVGSLEHRHIDRTVEGVARFIREYRERVPISYDIVGFGPADAEATLRNSIAASGCGEAITFHGRVPYPQLRPFLERDTIGIAFIPLTAHYQCQPATKLFEYLLAGMAAVATSTDENRRIMGPHNGVLVDDTADSVYGGLVALYRNLHSYDSAAIRASVGEYTWEHIVTHKLTPYLRSLISDRAAVAPRGGKYHVHAYTEKGML